MASPEKPGSRTAAADPIYVGSGIEALVEVQLDAWEHGQRAALSEDQPLDDIVRITRAAEMACDDALLRYIPLDEARFRDAYTLAWSAGYCSQARARKAKTQPRKPIPTA